MKSANDRSRKSDINFSPRIMSEVCRRLGMYTGGCDFGAFIMRGSAAYAPRAATTRHASPLQTHRIALACSFSPPLLFRYGYSREQMPHRVESVNCGARLDG